MNFPAGVSHVWLTWARMQKIFFAHRVILLPFAVVACADLGVTAFFYLAPSPPISLLLAPPIRFFFGEAALHYPLHLFLLTRLAQWAHVALTFLLGVLMTGMSIGMLAQAAQGERPLWLKSLKGAFRSYFKLVAIWTLMAMATGLFGKLAQRILGDSLTSSELFFYLNLWLAVLVQVLFLYAMPAIVIEARPLWEALRRGFQMGRELFVPTLMVVLAPIPLFLGVRFLNLRLTPLVVEQVPEVSLLLIALGILVTMVVDFLVTSSTTLLFLGNRR